MMPLVPVYAAGWALRAAGFLLGAEPVRRLQWPVVSVGNLSAGGTGKTPFTIALAKLLVAEGLHVDVLSRGYGRRGSDAARADAAGTADEFGDEPLLIAREAGVPVFVARRRYEAGLLAEQDSAVRGVHLLDDGFQHRQLARAVDIVLVNSEDLADRLLPAGNLREPLSALRRATVFGVPAGDEAALARLRKLGLTQPVWRFRREMSVPEVDGPVVAFCGIARPEQFFAGIEAAGVAIAARRAFPDHHRFVEGDLRMLNGLAKTTGAVAMVTTAKDRVRLGALEARLAAPLLTAGLRVVLGDEAGVAAWLRGRLAEERFGADHEMESGNRGPK
jgi:tetraacyldisaccharide 4'-kinase